MDWSVWLTLLGVCFVGAATPGPSLALILHHTLNGGRPAGAVAAVGHGSMVGLYALATVFGLGALLDTAPVVYQVIQVLGAVFLLYLGISGLRAAAGIEPSGGQTQVRHAYRDGFLMALLNPFAILFFVALFSQFVHADTPVGTKLVYAATAWLMDTSWYLSVAWLFSRPKWLQWLQQYSQWLERLFGVVLLAFGLQLLAGVIW